MALVVVDEAILSLTGYALADPLDVFYGPLWSNLSTKATRSSILLTRSDLLDAGRTPHRRPPRPPAGPSRRRRRRLRPRRRAPTPTLAVATARLRSVAPAAPIDVREDFEPLAVYAPGQVTGADGTVTVACRCPTPSPATG